MSVQSPSQWNRLARIFICILSLSAVFTLGACGHSNDPYPFEIRKEIYNYNPVDRTNKCDDYFCSIILVPGEDMEILATRIDGIDPSDGDKTWQPEIYKDFFVKKGEECRLATWGTTNFDMKVLKIFTDKGTWIIDLDASFDPKTGTLKPSSNFLKGEKISETLDPKALKKRDNWIR